MYLISMVEMTQGFTIFFFQGKGKKWENKYLLWPKTKLNPTLPALLFKL